MSNQNTHRSTKRADTAERRDRHGDLLPPWMAFPTIRRFSIEWSSGHPHEHLQKWSQWYFQLAEQDRRVYRRRYRAPWPLWTGSYLVLSRSRLTTMYGFATSCVIFFGVTALRFILFPWANRIRVD